MKQHITLEQLKEIDITFLEWIALLDLKWNYREETLNEEDYEELVKQITIGKMMEIIMSKDIKIKISVYKTSDSILLEVFKESFIAEELCDALWKATKFIKGCKQNKSDRKSVTLVKKRNGGNSRI